MSDTWELWELGPHDCTKPHEWPFGLDTLCEGGKRVVLRKVRLYYHHGTDEDGDTSTWFVPVVEGARVWVEEAT